MNTKKRLQSQTKRFNHRRTILSLLIGGSVCAAAPAWAECTYVKASNGGIIANCSGDNIYIDPDKLSLTNNVVTVGVKSESGERTTVVGTIYGTADPYRPVTPEGPSETPAVLENNHLNIINSQVDNVYAVALKTYATFVEEVNGSRVTLENSSAKNVYGSATLGWGKIQKAKNNKVELIQSEAQFVMGGEGDIATGNQVELVHSEAKFVMGGEGYIAKDNQVILSDNSKVESVYGGFAPDYYYYEDISVRGNSVTLKNSEAEFIYGGLVTTNPNTNMNKTVNINNNIISINENSKINSTNSGIFGGYLFGNLENFDIVTGNTFNFNNKNSIEVARMGNFETYNIFLQESGENYFKNNRTKDKALITVTKRFGNDLSTTQKNSTPELAKANLMVENQAFTKTEVQGVKEGDTFYILSMADEVKYSTGTSLEENIIINKNNDDKFLKEGENKFTVGTIYLLETKLKLEDGSVYLEVVDLNDNSSILEIDKNALDRESPVLDSKIAALSVINSGNDLSRDILIGIEPTQKGEIIAFGKVAGEHNKTKGTSDININGVNAILGAGLTLTDQTIVGGYFEYGYGHYDSTRDFESYDRFSAMHYKGKGNVNYQGLGALIKSYVNDNFYVSGGIKLGTIRTNYSSTSFTDYDYRTANMDYSKSKFYFGAQIGTGLKLQLTENSQLNSSINFIYTQIGGNGFELDDSHIQLNKVKSERLVLNEEYKYFFNENLGLKLSGAFDYEFSSIAEGTIDDHKMTDSSLRGGTVILGAGVLITPFEDRNNQYFDLSVNASAGKNQSIGGSFTFNYRF